MEIWMCTVMFETPESDPGIRVIQCAVESKDYPTHEEVDEAVRMAMERSRKFTPPESRVIGYEAVKEEVLASEQWPC